MNQLFSPIRKLLLSGLCVFLLIGGILFAPHRALTRGALAWQLPPGEYDHIGEAVTPTNYGYAPYAGGRGFPQTVFWGDLHLHTVYSFDAGADGTRLGPVDSYRFARGEEVTTETGEKVRLSRPLDFLAVTDHSDGLGTLEALLAEPDADLQAKCGEDYAQVKEWKDAIEAGGQAAADAAGEIVAAFANGESPPCLLELADFQTAWDEEIQAAEDYNDPGDFTAFIGYEWTSLITGNNLHRNVIYRDAGDKATQVLPYITQAPYGSTDPEKLWDWMESYETSTGGNVLAIPHNGNLSNGLMFDNVDSYGQPLSATYAQRRQLWEPIYETIQIKGTGETHPLLSPDDEFAGFEVAGWDFTNLDGSIDKPTDPELLKEMYEREYSRAALKNGLNWESQLGTNPFKFGLIGSTDSHIAISAVEENSYFGKFVSEAPSPHRAMYESGIGRVGWQYGSAGYVGVWARENTRESLFDAMERREVYATSGSRMVVRLFGGWDFTADDVGRNPGDVGYEKGVPMGSDLSAAPTGQSPTFLVAALKDPIRGNLDRIQIIKGWLDPTTGTTDEKVYDVVWSDGRQLVDGKLPPVGSVVDPGITDPTTDPGTVDTDTATWTNTIGAAELATVWKDPEFDPTQRAFYYARVLEIPTPRWTNYDEVFFGKDEVGLTPEAPRTLQERAYTSPIWYSPAETTSPFSRFKSRRKR